VAAFAGTSVACTGAASIFSDATVTFSGVTAFVSVFLDHGALIIAISQA
jgi:hypothetical protein